MREYFGGAFILKLLFVFIVIFVSFMAVTISYAKAFRVKNQVINIVEQNQYSGTGDVGGKTHAEPQCLYYTADHPAQQPPG